MLLCVTLTWVLLNVVMHPLSQSCPIESKAWLASPGNMWASVAGAGRPGKLMLQVCVDQMQLPSGSFTWMGVIAATLLVNGLLVRM